MFDNVNAKENEITTISMRNHRHFKISFRLLCHLTIKFKEILDLSISFNKRNFSKISQQK